MEGSSVHAVELVFLLLLLFVIVFAYVARKLQLPYPIVLVIAGLFLSFVPGIPKITMSPDIIFPRCSPSPPVCGRVVHLLARFFLQHRQHPFSGFRPCRVHGLGRG